MILRGTLEGIRPYLAGWANATTVRTNYDKAKKSRARTLLNEINAVLETEERDDR